MNARAQEIPTRPRLAFLGLGWIGRQRAEALAASGAAHIVAFADADATRAAALLDRHPGARAVTSQQALGADELDGIVIATPSALHEAQALAALDRGLAVFCQKPVAIDAAGTRRVIARAASRDRLLGADFSYREVTGLRELRERLRNRELGTIVAIDLTFHNAYAPAAAWSNDIRLAGGGCLLDLGIHLLDLASWLQDFPALEVHDARLYAGGRVLDSPGTVEDFAAATLVQPTGAVVRLACSWHLHAGQGAIIEVALHGSRGGAMLRNVAGSFLDLELSLTTGDQRRVLGRDEAWGPRALLDWTRRLAADPRFDEHAWHFGASAQAIDAIYRHRQRGLSWSGQKAAWASRRWARAYSCWQERPRPWRA